MIDYRELLEGRVAVFDRQLQTLVLRRSKERASDCFIIFSGDPLEDQTTKELEVAKALQLSLVAAEGDGSGGAGDRAARDESGGRGDGSSDGLSHYVQFAFMKRTFYMDLPNLTLFQPEGERLLRERPGFFRLRDRRWSFMTFEEWTETVAELDPTQKEYLNADTRTAAEDMAYILYTLWKFPVDTPLYFKAMRFARGARKGWEGCGLVAG